MKASIVSCTALYILQIFYVHGASVTWSTSYPSKSGQTLKVVEATNSGSKSNGLEHYIVTGPKIENVVSLRNPSYPEIHLNQQRSKNDNTGSAKIVTTFQPSEMNFGTSMSSHTANDFGSSAETTDESSAMDFGSSLGSSNMDETHDMVGGGVDGFNGLGGSIQLGGVGMSGGIDGGSDMTGIGGAGGMMGHSRLGGSMKLDGINRASEMSVEGGTGGMQVGLGGFGGSGRLGQFSGSFGSGGGSGRLGETSGSFESGGGSGRLGGASGSFVSGSGSGGGLGRIDRYNMRYGEGGSGGMMSGVGSDRMNGNNIMYSDDGNAVGHHIGYSTASQNGGSVNFIRPNGINGYTRLGRLGRIRRQIHPILNGGSYQVTRMPITMSWGQK